MAVKPAHDETDEKPLDPAVERVRRKLVRFVAINLGILFIALMAVVGALVYRATTETGEGREASTLAPPSEGGMIDGRIQLPAGARILSQSTSGDRLTLQIALPGGDEAFHVFEMQTGRIVARFTVVAE